MGPRPEAPDEKDKSYAGEASLRRGVVGDEWGGPVNGPVTDDDMVVFDVAKRNGSQLSALIHQT